MWGRRHHNMNVLNTTEPYTLTFLGLPLLLLIPAHVCTASCPTEVRVIRLLMMNWTLSQSCWLGAGGVPRELLWPRWGCISESPCDSACGAVPGTQCLVLGRTAARLAGRLPQDSEVCQCLVSSTPWMSTGQIPRMVRGQGF